jgi:hypothetical protein
MFLRTLWASVHLLRSCGQHERAIDVANRLQQHGGGSDGARQAVVLVTN